MLRLISKVRQTEGLGGTTVEGGCHRPKLLGADRHGAATPATAPGSCGKPGLHAFLDQRPFELGGMRSSAYCGLCGACGYVERPGLGDARGLVVWPMYVAKATKWRATASRRVEHCSSARVANVCRRSWMRHARARPVATPASCSTRRKV